VKGEKRKKGKDSFAFLSTFRTVKRERRGSWGKKEEEKVGALLHLLLSSCCQKRRGGEGGGPKERERKGLQTIPFTCSRPFYLHRPDPVVEGEGKNKIRKEKGGSSSAPSRAQEKKKIPLAFSVGGRGGKGKKEGEVPSGRGGKKSL